jgi:phage/plasmid primase-like uncharacterized protein
VIGEGFATMAAVHHATGHGVVAAMSARNLETVARSMRKLFPSRTLIVAADDDRHLSENIGLEAAQRAAESVGALLATPLPLGPKRAQRTQEPILRTFRLPRSRPGSLKPGGMTMRNATAPMDFADMSSRRT